MRAIALIIAAFVLALLGASVFPWVPFLASVGVVSIGAAALLAWRVRAQTLLGFVVLAGLASDAMAGGYLGRTTLLMLIALVALWPLFKRARAVGDRGSILLAVVVLALVEAIALAARHPTLPLTSHLSVVLAHGSATALASAAVVLIASRFHGKV